MEFSCYPCVFDDYDRVQCSRTARAVGQDAALHQNWSLKRSTLWNPSKSNNSSVDPTNSAFKMKSTAIRAAICHPSYFIAHSIFFLVWGNKIKVTSNPLDVSICLHKHPLIGFHTVPFKIVVADCSVWVHSWPFWLCCSGDCEQLLSAVLAIFELVQGFLSAEDVSCLNLKYT